MPFWRRRARICTDGAFSTPSPASPPGDAPTQGDRAHLLRQTGFSTRHSSYGIRQKTPKTSMISMVLAERKGFEPSRRLNTICALSRGVPSTTRPPLRWRVCGLERRRWQAAFRHTAAESGAGDGFCAGGGHASLCSTRLRRRGGAAWPRFTPSRAGILNLAANCRWRFGAMWGREGKVVRVSDEAHRLSERARSGPSAESITRLCQVLADF